MKKPNSVLLNDNILVVGWLNETKELRMTWCLYETNWEYLGCWYSWVFRKSVQSFVVIVIYYYNSENGKCDELNLLKGSIHFSACRIRYSFHDSLSCSKVLKILHYEMINLSWRLLDYLIIISIPHIISKITVYIWHHQLVYRHETHSHHILFKYRLSS